MMTDCCGSCFIEKNFIVSRLLAEDAHMQLCELIISNGSLACLRLVLKSMSSE